MLDAAFDDVGSAGGHREVAGGEIPPGIFADADDAELIGIVDRAVTGRLVEGLGLGSSDDGTGYAAEG